MGRTTKEGGEGCARSWRSPEESGQAQPDKPRPFLSPPGLTCRAAANARPLALTLEGGGESAHAQAQFTEQVCVEVEVRLVLTSLGCHFEDF